MSRKPSTPTPAPPPARRRYTTLLTAALIVVAAGVIYYSGRARAPESGAAAAATQPEASQPPHARPPDTGPVPTEPPAWAKFGPHAQATLPPLDFPAYDTPRPRAVVEAAYHFAAEHPEVLTYVPCFCGCERAGHRGNEDCFVRERAMNGDVLTWEPHGMECTVCIDVATRAAEMFRSGATLRQIHDAIDADFGARYPTMTPTPVPR